MLCIPYSVVTPQLVVHKKLLIGKSLENIANIGASANECKTARHISIKATLKSRFKNKRFLTDYGKPLCKGNGWNLYPLPGWVK